MEDRHRPSATALIVAAGSGSRLGGTAKQFRKLGDRSVLAHAVDAMMAHRRITDVRVVVAADAHEEARAALAGRDVGPLIDGGATRSQSVRNGLQNVESEYVFIHDAARPFCPAQVVDRLFDALETHEAAVPVLASVDTLAVRNGQQIGSRIDRDSVLRVQTPQAFRLDALNAALDRWQGDDPTDETQVVQSAGGAVAFVEGDVRLDKLTTGVDWTQAVMRLEQDMISRSGTGFDVHAFDGPGPLMLGGIEIAHDKGLKGHSDADVCLHAITDALLGAAALGDIGQHFPPSDARWKGADSEKFLAHAASLITDRGGIIDHVDATIICEAPKVGPHRDAIRRNIARILNLSETRVSIKATTTERMGFTGRGEGMAAQAIATVRMKD